MLTEDQNRGLNQALHFLQTSRAVLIEGSAGTGKTYMIRKLIESLNSNHVLCSAPTHKALEILKEKIGILSGVSYATTHSALKLKRKINRDGSVNFKPSFNQKYPPLKNIKYFIIDEVSMLNAELLEVAEQQAGVQNCKIIFVGDIKQINPVGEVISPVFTREYPTVTLTEIIRQDSDSPIIPLSLIASVSGNLDGYDDNFVIINGKPEGYISTSNKSKIISELSEANGNDEVKYIAYNNADVDSINDLVRNNIYGNPARIEVGETIILSAPHKEIYNNNEEIKVESLTIEEISMRVRTHAFKDRFETLKIKYYSIKPEKQKDGKSIDILHEDSISLFNNTVQDLKNKCIRGDYSWKKWYEIVERFADFKYNHALTIHKSQGSGYGTVILNVGSIAFCGDIEEKKKLLYTAITRTKKLLILYNN